VWQGFLPSRRHIESREAPGDEVAMGTDRLNALALANVHNITPEPLQN